MKRQGIRISLIGLILILIFSFGASAQNTAPGDFASADAAQGLEILQQLQASFRAVAQKVIPTVVRLDVVELVEAPVVTSPFDYFFGQNNQQQDQQNRQYRQNALGSGVIISYEGNRALVLTNAHVAADAEEISVTLSDGRSYVGSLVGSDERTDIALVSFESDEAVPVATIGNSDDLQVGDWVLAIGNPLGFSSSMTSGIVSATGRESAINASSAGFTDYIQTDAAINQGNSGGPLVNLRGEVMGINTWIASPSGGNVGLGFAVPVNSIQGAISQLAQSGKVEYGWLGAYVSDAANLIPGLEGAYISNVFLDSPAERAGLTPGDTVTSIDGVALQDADDLIRIIGNAAPGSTVQMTIVRGDDQRRARVRITQREADEQRAESQVWPGFVVTQGDDQEVIISGVIENSPASLSGLKAGDRIISINDQNVGDISDVIAAIQPNDDEYRLRIERDGAQFIIGLIP